MSINNLSGMDDFQHCFSDDMESFFYVVLYAGALWLAHNHLEHLGELMTDYFNEYQYGSKQAKGGSLKGQDLLLNTFVRNFEWGNDGISEWINKMQALLKAAFWGRSKLSPGSLVEVWEAVQKKDLPNNDRQIHELMHEEEEFEPGEEDFVSEFDTDTSSIRSVQSTLSETPSTGSKRSATVASMDESSIRSDHCKRLRRSVRLLRLRQM